VTAGNGSATPAAGYNDRLEADLRALLEYSRRPARRSAKRLRAHHEEPHHQDEEQQYSYLSINTAIRAHYEQLQDFQRASKMQRPYNRKRSKRDKSGQFNTPRLRALEKYLLSANGPGMSEKGMDNFFKFMQRWEKAPKKGKHRRKRIDEYFKSCNALKTAVDADLDKAMEDAGWLQTEFVEGGVQYEAYFLPVMDVMMQMVARADDVKYWSGTSGPGEPTERRETAMDGDVFRLFEKHVCSKGKDNFVLGFHVYSDSHVLSGSGGKCWLAPRSFEGARVATRQREARARCDSMGRRE